MSEKAINHELSAYIRTRNICVFIWDKALKINYQKLYFFILACFLFVNINGCATGILWDKQHSFPLENSKIGATSGGFYASCKTKKMSENYIVIPYEINEKFVEGNIKFPPFNEGFVIIPSSRTTDNLVNEINKIQSPSFNNRYIITFLNAKILKTVLLNDENTFKYHLKFVLGEKSRFGRVKSEVYGSDAGRYTTGEIDIFFEEKFDFNQNNIACESLTTKPIIFNILFTKQSSEYLGEHKNSASVRAVASPFAIVFDIITLPFQLIGLLFAVSIGNPT